MLGFINKVINKITQTRIRHTTIPNTVQVTFAATSTVSFTQYTPFSNHTILLVGTYSTSPHWPGLLFTQIPQLALHTSPHWPGFPIHIDQDYSAILFTRPLQLALLVSPDWPGFTRLTYADQDFIFTLTYTDQGPQYTHGPGLTYTDQDSMP